MAQPGRHRLRAAARPARRRAGAVRRSHRLAAPVAALLAATALTWHTASAAFTAGTANPGNTWSTGTVVLGDDDTANTTVNLSNLMPNTPQTRCVTVTYTGTTVLSTPVRLYAGSTTGTLGPYLRLTVEEGTGTPTNACAGFTPTTTVYDAATPTASSGTLGSFTVNRTSYATGVGAWTPTAPGQTTAYRFTLELIPDEAAQGSSISTTITWQARS